MSDVTPIRFTLEFNGIDAFVRILESFFKCGRVGRDYEHATAVGVYSVFDFLSSGVENTDWGTFWSVFALLG